MRSRLVRAFGRQRISEGAIRLSSITALLLFTGCVTSSFNPQSSTERYLASGTLGLTRPIPSASGFQEPMARMRPPQDGPTVSGVPKLIVDGSQHSLTLALPGESPVVLQAQGAYALKKGTYTVALKQTDPLWYAPPSYFLRRGMRVPPDGSKGRFMRGALGHQALFFDKQTAIHSGPVWNEEIGGIKIAREDMARLFEAIAIGTKVEVR